MKTMKTFYWALSLSLTAVMAVDCEAAKKKPEPVQLTAVGTKALKEYTKALTDLRKGLESKLPSVTQNNKSEFLKAYEVEQGSIKRKKNRQGKVSEVRVNNTYNNAKAEFASLEAARSALKEVDGALSSSALDRQLVKCAVLASATPRGLAEFAQLGAAQKKGIDALLADPKLMQEMLYAGGAKAGRYGKAMEIYQGILAASKRAGEGHFNRLAIATSLELAAPEICGYAEIDPVKRYQFFEKSYLDKELDSSFDKFTTWQYRQVINEPQSDEDMLWMREMLWNYRPDLITAPEGFGPRYVGLMNTEFGHKRPEFDKALPTSRIQQTVDRGGQCGPKAFFGRCLSRSFGVPTWGARLRSHTAMSYWTPKGWTTILGVSWKNGFWTSDKPEQMRATYFLLGAMAREDSAEYLKACRAQWFGDAMGEEKVSGMYSGTGGLWNSLALNQMRAIAMKEYPPKDAGKRPWETDAYGKEAAKTPDQMMKAKITTADRKIVVDSTGRVTIPAVACVSPKTNTDKIVFMNSRNDGMQLHYKRWKEPEPFSYEVTVPKAGRYALTANVVTVNRDQFFLLTVNGAKEPAEMKLPYTVGKWGESKPIKVSLRSGKNTLQFTRTVPADFVKLGWKGVGPEYGGITIKEFQLQPAGQ